MILAKRNETSRLGKPYISRSQRASYHLCCLFIRNDIETTETQGHSNITVLCHHHLCDATRDTLHTTRGSAHSKMPKVPSKCERGESSSSGVAQRPLDRCLSEVKNSSRENSSRASTSQRLGDEQHQPTKIGPRAKLQHPAAAPLVQDGHYGC